jgi:hypothetical protein
MAASIASGFGGKALACAGRLVFRPSAPVQGLSAAPDVQHAFAKAADEMVGHVRWQYLAKIIERAAHHGRKFMCRSMLRPAASQIQSALPLNHCVHRLWAMPR